MLESTHCNGAFGIWDTHARTHTHACAQTHAQTMETESPYLQSPPTLLPNGMQLDKGPEVACTLLSKGHGRASTQVS